MRTVLCYEPLDSGGVESELHDDSPSDEEEPSPSEDVDTSHARRRSEEKRAKQMQQLVQLMSRSHNEFLQTLSLDDQRKLISGR